MVYQIERVQELPIGLDEAWDFFSDPRNLSDITPPFLKFRIMGDPPRMYAGQIIRYRIQIPPGIPVNWTTEITHVRPREFFVDEQRVGPYKLWHHQHWFEAIEGGVRMRDLVHYQPPLGPLGMIAQAVYLGPYLRRIFDFRREMLAALWSGKDEECKK